MSEYTEGISGDDIVILKDGVMIDASEILNTLNEHNELIKVDVISSNKIKILEQLVGKKEVDALYIFNNMASKDSQIDYLKTLINPVVLHEFEIKLSNGDFEYITRDEYTKLKKKKISHLMKEYAWYLFMAVCFVFGWNIYPWLKGLFV